MEIKEIIQKTNAFLAEEFEVSPKALPRGGP